MISKVCEGVQRRAESVADDEVEWGDLRWRLLEVSYEVSGVKMGSCLGRVWTTKAIARSTYVGGFLEVRTSRRGGGSAMSWKN